MRSLCLLLGFSFLMFLVSIVVAEAASNSSKHGVYIVYMGAATSPQGAPRADHAHLLNELINRKNTSVVVQIYYKSFSGFAARLLEEEAKSIGERPGVVSVFPEASTKLHTTRSWDFLQSQSQIAFQNKINSTDSSNASDFWSGRDTIIGFIDAGIWPQHPSFDDKDMGPVPQRWKGTCMRGDDPIPLICNRKVIGARYYDNPDSITTAMDKNGHGSHTTSTAAGIPVYGASYYGFGKGVARGGSPNSRIAMYRACGFEECLDSSILKAFDDAIDDGVDIINVSIGGIFDNFFNDPISIGSFHAMEKGVIVVASAGNFGPSPGTVFNYSPWILTVGATTMDRDFEMDIVLGRGDKVIKGGGITFLKKSATYPLVDGRSAGYDDDNETFAAHCVPGSLDDAKVKGKIVLCEYNFGNFDPMLKQGVKGIILIGNGVRQETNNYGFRPVVYVSETDGDQIYSYINSTRNPRARILPTVEVKMNYKPAPVVYVYSSRGPAPGLNNLIIKPDVTAPGVSVLGATCFNDTQSALPGKKPPLFHFESGTSMSTPHVSGLAATVKSWHPTWTPSAIRSAIMTTAITTNNDNAPITTFEGSRATPYDIGSGDISLSGPLWPGLVYEIETIDYILFLCNLGYNTSMIKIMSLTVPNNFACPCNSSLDLISDLNYPSIAVSGLIPNVKKTVKRTVTNVGKDCSTFNVVVEAPSNVHVQVVPNKLHFTKNVKKLSFEVIFVLTASSSTSTEDTFGSITWSNMFCNVRSPFVVSNA